jgi:hypothetical protein
MFRLAISTLAAALVAVASSASQSAGAMNQASLRVDAFLPSTTESASWICDRADNICGLDDPRMLSKPAKIDYDLVLKATPEFKKMRDEKIDASSSEGIQLRQKGIDRVRERADSVRIAHGYCSVWKTIKHKDSREIPDVTEQVKALL